MDDDVRERLRHVLWIGGGPCGGKSTLARFLAGKYDLKIYDADWHHVHEHGDRPGGVPPNWNALSMDERWLLPSPQELAERDIRNWTARFPLIVEDLLRWPTARRIVAEGPSVFPWEVSKVVRSPRQAVFLLPTPEWRDGVVERRRRNAGPRFEDRTSDPERAHWNVRERERLMGQRIVDACDELGLRWVRMDGSLDLDDTIALLEDQFRPHLPTTHNV